MALKDQLTSHSIRPSAYYPQEHINSLSQKEKEKANGGRRTKINLFLKKLIYFFLNFIFGMDTKGMNLVVLVAVLSLYDGAGDEAS